MKYICKSDVLYIVMYSFFSIFFGFLSYANTPSVFYELVTFDYLEVGPMEIMMIAMWSFSKMIAIIFLVQYFINAYETCYIYFRIRNRKGNSWFYHILENITAKLFIMSVIKALLVFFFVRSIDVSLIVYEYVYIMLFVFLYMSLYLLIRHNKLTLYLVMGHLLLYELSAMMKLTSLQRYLFLCDVNLMSILVICGITIIFMGLFNYLLKYKNEGDGGRV